LSELTNTTVAISDDLAGNLALGSDWRFALSHVIGGLNSSVLRLEISTISCFIYDQATGNLFFDTDGLSGNTQIHIAQLTTKPLLSNTHITIIA